MRNLRWKHDDDLERMTIDEAHILERGSPSRKQTGTQIASIQCALVLISRGLWLSVQEQWFVWLTSSWRVSKGLGTLRAHLSDIKCITYIVTKPSGVTIPGLRWSRHCHFASTSIMANLLIFGVPPVGSTPWLVVIGNARKWPFHNMQAILQLARCMAEPWMRCQEL